MRDLILIAAVSKGFGLGREGQLPWHLPGDLAYFKKVTTAAPPGKQNIVVMGRKTWESIPPKYRPLKDRINVVLSKSMESDDVHVIRSLAELDKIEGAHKTFVIGGGMVYKEALPYASTILLTKIDIDTECDVFFPTVSGFREVWREEHTEHGITYCFTELRKENKICPNEGFVRQLKI